ncbi:GntR family transcriptional regulator [Nocardia panacis]|uniref:GntR family transcriptional regulator n=1 Tax=Nocardia panacis TaxID=2340916 RepID=A0A3A4KCX4_9NOCA|nr:GntR family transcriptional regulator [Nocardia panacis]RJO70685.1 GntR family transcriptional regulator [Nocardia panacis]
MTELPGVGRDLTDAAYHRIRSMLLHQELRPGERTSVGQLCAALGLGRAPVKAAIDRLAGEGLFRIRGRSGTSVTSLTATGVRQMFEMRSLYEDGAAPLIAERITDEQIADVLALVPALTAGPTPEQRLPDELARRIEFIDKDVEFHRLIIAGANNPQLSDAYRSLNLHLLISHYLVLDAGAHERQRQDEHVEIARALAQRDADALAAALRRHADAVRDAITRTIDHRAVAH